MVTQQRTSKTFIFQYFYSCLFPCSPCSTQKLNPLYVKIFIYYFLYIFFLYRVYVFRGNDREQGTSNRQIRCVNFRQIVKCCQICLYTNAICRISCDSCLFSAFVVICYKHIPTLRPRQKSG